MNLNNLKQNRYSLTLDGLEVEYKVKEFTLPGLRMEPVELKRQGWNMPFSSDTPEFEELSLTFLVDADMKNWLELFDWFKSTFPGQMSDPYADIYKDCILTIHGSQHYPIEGRIKFQNTLITGLGEISFTQESMEAEDRTSTLTLRYDQYVPEFS